MRTNIPGSALENPDISLANDIIRNCVHCGFCLSHCPTYQVRRDENDSPRGRIILIRDMYEKGGVPDEKTVEHLDRCLTCLACEAMCPSGVTYSKLIGHAREHVEANFRRSLFQRVIRRSLTVLIPSPTLFRMGLLAGKLARPLKGLFSGPLRAMLDMTPKGGLPKPSPVDRAQVFPASGPRRARVGILIGCVQTVLAPQINAATIRLLQRHGVEVVVSAGAGCCGAPAEHMGREDLALPMVKAKIHDWLTTANEPGGLDAIIVNTSGCGTSLKAYGHALRLDPVWREKAARVSALSKDITEFMTQIGLRRPENHCNLRVVYHSACSMQHGQKITREPKALLAQAGFVVKDVPEGHLCCGSAGTYNILQPAIAKRLAASKAANIAR
ncbi:MAG TPA: glycolate oxidase subunit GlcF, partial [Steroidobacteraceae bacterium]